MRVVFSFAVAVVAMSGAASHTNAWVTVVLPTTSSTGTVVRSTHHSRPCASRTVTSLFFAPDPERDSDESAAAAAAAVDAGLVQGEPHVHLGNTNPTNPCWQDIYDDDCAMSTMYSASFIAKNWIKAMPCAEGIEDCDMPEQTTHPGYEGIDDVDVMDFLGIKRAKNLGAQNTNKST